MTSGPNSSAAAREGCWYGAGAARILEISSSEAEHVSRLRGGGTVVAGEPPTSIDEVGGTPPARTLRYPERRARMREGEGGAWGARE